MLPIYIHGKALYTAVHEVTAWYVQKQNAAVCDHRTALELHGQCQKCRSRVMVHSQPPSQHSQNWHVTPAPQGLQKSGPNASDI